GILGQRDAGRAAGPDDAHGGGQEVHRAAQRSAIDHPWPYPPGRIHRPEHAQPEHRVVITNLLEESEGWIVWRWLAGMVIGLLLAEARCASEQQRQTRDRFSLESRTCPGCPAMNTYAPAGCPTHSYSFSGGGRTDFWFEF